MMSAFVMMSLSSCEEVDVTVEYLDVTSANLKGHWELVSINGNPLADGSFFYISFEKDEFRIRENLTSIPNGFSEDEGTYSIYTDEDLGASCIRGINSVQKEWNDRYVVKDLTSESMTWVGVANPSSVQTFMRIPALPILAD